MSQHGESYFDGWNKIQPLIKIHMLVPVDVFASLDICKMLVMVVLK